MKAKIAIEIGTSYTKIFKSRADVVLCEPTLIAIQKGNYKKPVAVGVEAEKLIGKVSDDVKIIRPINNTTIIDHKALRALLASFVSKIKVKNELMPDVILTVGCGSDGEIISEFEDVLNRVGLYNVTYAEAPVLALLGADAPLTDNSCHAVIDLGGGQTTVCVLNLSGVISGVSAEIGGNDLNRMIIAHCEETLNLTLSESEVENLKRSIASLILDDDSKTVVQGRETSSGKPRSLNVTASQISKPVQEYSKKVAEIANLVLSKLNGDCIKEITKNGIYLSGGGSNLYGIEEYFTKILGYKTNVVPEPDLSIIIGAGKLISDKALLNKLKLKS
ncbi:MAG: rod shape-determining protein [Clostridia bacterium]|nr:rod shape-determining protein [Clostridia bacterium]